MGERAWVGKIRGDKHEFSEDKYILERKKFGPDFLKKGWLRY